MHGFSPFYSPIAMGPIFAFLPLLMIVAAWSIVLKGFALWHAAKDNEKWWFVAMLVINTLGILEIIYLVWFRHTSPHTRKKHASHTHTPTPSNES